MARHLHRILRGESDLAHRATRRRRQPFRQHVLKFHIFFVQSRNHKVNKLVGFRPENRFFFCDQALFHHLDGDSHCRQASAFAIARLQHVEFAVLNRELKILHVFVMVFQPSGDFAELFEDIGHDLFKLTDFNRRTHARDHVLALRVQQKFSVELFGAS